MSLRSFLSMKKHKYESPNDFKNMTIEQIIKTDPKDIGTYINDMKEMENLSSKQKEALNKLVAIKKMEKELKGVSDHKKQQMRNSYINNYLSTQTAVNNLIIKTNNEMLEDSINMKNIQNRLNRLKNLQETPYTEEENVYIRSKKLNEKGGKKKSKKTIKNKLRKTRKNKI
jgi:hypothetical protein